MIVTFLLVIILLTSLLSWTDCCWIRKKLPIFLIPKIFKCQFLPIDWKCEQRRGSFHFRSASTMIVTYLLVIILLTSLLSWNDCVWIREKLFFSFQKFSNNVNFYLLLGSVNRGVYFSKCSLTTDQNKWYVSQSNSEKCTFGFEGVQLSLVFHGFVVGLPKSVLTITRQVG